ncbi:unnamed protein product [Spirodela intermedia]|uniref:Uncharacterized protein n=1 Tax=Spirodela intermedia TaxID=51605 RepID=A0A7I8J6L2_SPIIN|nr:unnamed protein product [Spirodela intermedia]CAA6665876.1 unnamed protein product [Spirodela intermedia]
MPLPLGHAIIGTPWTTLSSDEFQPQCVRNPPVDSCRRIFTCGAHDDTTSPNLLVLSTKPSGKKANGSVSCSSGRVPPLPKDTNSTDPRGCSSSHATQPDESLSDSSPPFRTSGPTGALMAPPSRPSKLLRNIPAASRYRLLCLRSQV